MCYFCEKKKTITGLKFRLFWVVIRKNMLVWFHNFSVGALDSIKVLYDKSNADNKGEKLHQKRIRLDVVAQ